MYTRRQWLSGALGVLATAGCAPLLGARGSTSPASTPAPCREPRAYVQFAINTHDWLHYDESADTLLRAIDIFERYGVRGDFYLLGTMAKVYQQHRPDVIERLRASRQSVSYHIRPPHPVYYGFDSKLQRLSESTLQQTLLDYETYGLDLSTGELKRNEKGGYTLVSEVFGRPPVAAAAPSSSPRIRAVEMEVCRSLGAKMAVQYHEAGTAVDQPFVYQDGLLVRPSDFGVTRWSVGELGKNNDGLFWWNMLGTPHAAAYNPTAYLTEKMKTWQAARPAFITALIHENNFSRSGPESWTPIYWSDMDKKQPRAAPFNLSATDPSRLRSESAREAIWEAYEELVAYAAANLAVASSEDIVALATASGTSGSVAPRCGATN